MALQMEGFISVMEPSQYIMSHFKVDLHEKEEQNQDQNDQQDQKDQDGNEKKRDTPEKKSAVRASLSDLENNLG